ncbi:MAG: choice-of-anchor C family protein [Planctomycetia bacterium]|nr:choice-of-anchor C family protein [Planctomycetia bacterium]
MKIPLLALVLSAVFFISITFSQNKNTNKLPVVVFKIGAVSGESFAAPVWLKFYPGGTYDPDGYIVLFEMDMDGDGTFDVSEETLTGGSYEFTVPGKYTTMIRVTDDKGGVTTKSKSFMINDTNATYTEVPKISQQVKKRKPENVELDKKLDSIIEEYKYQEEKPAKVITEHKIVYKEPDYKEDGLVAYYPFNGDTKDYSGNGNHGTNNGAIFVSGVSGKALEFDGNDYVKVVGNVYSNDMSLELWIKPSVINNGWRGFAGSQGTCGPNCRPFDLWIMPNKSGLHWWISKSNNSQVHAGSIDNFFTETNSWYHIVFVKDGTKLTIYKNGNAINLPSSPFTDIYKPNTFNIGAIDNYFKGIIDEVKIYNYALNADEVKTSSENQITLPKYEDVKKDKMIDTRINKDNLLVNGSFEEGPSVGSFKLFSKGDGIPGWKVTRATVDLVGDYFNSADGSNSLDLNGTSYGELQQKFSTKKGKQYMLSFYLAGNPGGGPIIKKMLVTIGNKSEEYQFDITGRNIREMGWEHHELIFTAKDKSTILIFESNHKSGPAAAGPVIDNVKVFAIEAEELVEETLTPKVIITDSPTIQLTADSYVYAYPYRNWNEANFGQSEFLGVGWHSTGGEQRGYLKFELPDISVDDLIKAQLTLFINKTIGKNSLNIGIYNVLESWEEGSGNIHSGKSEPIDSSGAIIWDYQPAFDDSVFAEFKLRKKRDKSIKVDITTLVKSWLANNSNYGLLLKPQGYLSGRVPTSIYVIYSKEYEDGTKAPVLELHVE